MSSPRKVYLITGCSSGLGVSLAKSALATGAAVIATARNPANTPNSYSELSELGATWLPLDITSDDLEAQFRAAVAVHGRIDVLVNNAGVGGTSGALEETPLTEARVPFDINFWGSVRMIQIALPVMRAQKAGCIVNISSASVYDLAPGVAFYAASKAALEAMSACLAREVAGFGIRVLLVAPADMRTPFLEEGKVDKFFRPLGEAYGQGSVKQTQQFLLAMHGRQTIDPVKAAERIVEAAEQSAERGEGGVIRLPIGMHAGSIIANHGKELLQCVKETESVWKSVEFPQGE